MKEQLEFLIEEYQKIQEAIREGIITPALRGKLEAYEAVSVHLKMILNNAGNQ